MKANASKHKAMSYGRMQEDEKRLKEEVKKLLEQAEVVEQKKMPVMGGIGAGMNCRRNWHDGKPVKKIREAKRS